MAQINFTNEAVPPTPPTGITALYIDSTSKHLSSKDDAGVVIDYATAVLQYSLNFQSSSYVLLNTDEVILVDSTGGAWTMTLPTVVGIPGKQFIIKDWKGNSLTNNITITPFGGETIDFTSSFIENVNYQSVTLISDGINNWSIT